MKVSATIPFMFPNYKYQNILHRPLNACLFGLTIGLGSGFFIPAVADEQVISQPETIATEVKTIASELKTIIESRQHPGLLSSDFHNRAENVNRLYELADYQLLWFGNAAALDNNRKAIALLQNTAENGLHRNRYDLKLLQDNLATAQTGDMLDLSRLALFDTAVSIEMLRYMYDLHYGQINPHGVDFKLGLRSKKIDLPELLKQHLDSGKLAQLNESLEPSIKQYQRLKKALLKYRELAVIQEKQEIVFSASLSIGKKHKQVQALREYLTMLDDYTGDANPAKPLVFSAADSAAVKKFQQRHGIQPSGTVNRATLDLLNAPLSQRINQIELSMERLRWLPERSSGSGLLVNVPAFHLWALNSEGDVDESQLSMRVVVGEAEKNQTPVLASEIQYLDFMPHWNVPYSIVKNEIIQKLEHGGNYLNAQNMELVPNFDRNVTPVAFNKSLLEDIRRGALKIRQRPGQRNALGRVKFIFPNANNVYLHDTPAGALFKKPRRDFSHGCVRVEKPDVLAEFLLQTLPKWDKTAIKKAMLQTNEQRVSLPKAVPITIFYTTAFFDQPDRLTFYPDIYGYDSVLQHALLAKPVEVADSSLFIQEAAADIPVEENATQ